MITGINESQTLTKHISCKCKFNLIEQKVSQINGEITTNVDVSVKNILYVKKILLRVLLHVIICDEGI